MNCAIVARALRSSFEYAAKFNVISTRFIVAYDINRGNNYAIFLFANAKLRPIPEQSASNVLIIIYL